MFRLITCAELRRRLAMCITTTHYFVCGHDEEEVEPCERKPQEEGSGDKTEGHACHKSKIAKAEEGSCTICRIQEAERYGGTLKALKTTAARFKRDFTIELETLDDKAVAFDLLKALHEIVPDWMEIAADQQPGGQELEELQARTEDFKADFIAGFAGFMCRAPFEHLTVRYKLLYEFQRLCAACEKFYGND